MPWKVLSLGFVALGGCAAVGEVILNGDAGRRDMAVMDATVATDSGGRDGTTGVADLGRDAPTDDDLGSGGSAVDGGPADASNDEGITLDGGVEPCTYSCTLNVEGVGRTTCLVDGSPVAAYGPGVGVGTFVGSIDMSAFTELEITLNLCSPTSWVFDVCDSSTCNGYGGDGATMSNSAEVQLLGTTLSAFGNNYAPTPGGMLFVQPDFVAAGSCAAYRLTIADQRIVGDRVDWRSPYLHRINPPMDALSSPDALWYLGLNRVPSPSSSDRVGTGVQSAELCFR